MSPARQMWRAVRRPGAVVLAAALIALAVPTAAMAAADSISITQQSGDETSGASATYSFACTFGSSQETEGAGAYLFNARTSGYVTQVATHLTTNSPAERAGTFTMSYAGLPADSYRIEVRCFGTSADLVGERSFTLASGVVSTTTSLTASATDVFPSDPVTLTASVADGDGGTVTFFSGGTPLSTENLVGRTATYTGTFGASTVVTAEYSGAEGISSSASGPVPITVTTAVTAPSSVQISEPVRVGEPAEVSLGSWSPSGTQFGYEWRIDGRPVGTGSTYTPVPADYDKQLTVVVTGTHPAIGPTGSASTSSDAARFVNAGYLAVGDLDLSGADGDGNAVLG